MRKLGVYACLFIATVTSAFAGVTVSSPVSGSTVGSPVSFAATATSATCSRGVASMGIYINDKRVYVVNDDTLNTKVSLGAGVYKTVVQEWDYCGGSTFTQVPIKVGGKMLPNLQASGGWRGWGELAPAYEICSSCSPKVNWAMSQSG